MVKEIDPIVIATYTTDIILHYYMHFIDESNSSGYI